MNKPNLTNKTFFIFDVSFISNNPLMFELVDEEKKVEMITELLLLEALENIKL